jgi:alpha 1,3-glucosidase
LFIVFRPIWIEYPEDERTFAMQDQFLVGPDLLVKPVTTQNQSLTEVYLPGNQNVSISLELKNILFFNLN